MTRVAGILLHPYLPSRLFWNERVLIDHVSMRQFGNVGYNPVYLNLAETYYIGKTSRLTHTHALTVIFNHCLEGEFLSFLMYHVFHETKGFLLPFGTQERSSLWYFAKRRCPLFQKSYVRSHIVMIYFQNECISISKKKKILLIIVALNQSQKVSRHDVHA